MKTQQTELYTAERVLDAFDRPFVDRAEVQSFVDELRDRDWWQLRNYSYWTKRVEIARQGGQLSMATYDRDKQAGLLILAPGQLHLRVVLHELAHVLAEAEFNSQSHDPWFARTYLELVYHEMGSEAFVALRNSFIREGVQYDA